MSTIKSTVLALLFAYGQSDTTFGNISNYVLLTTIGSVILVGKHQQYNLDSSPRHVFLSQTDEMSLALNLNWRCDGDEHLIRARHLD